MDVLAAILVTTLSGTPTFYVATDGSNGNTGGTGDPWATIDHALANVPDGSLILVRAGLYQGRVRLDEQFSIGVTVRSETPYMAQLRYDQGAALICFTCQNVTVEGFDIAHDPHQYNRPGGADPGSTRRRGGKRRRHGRGGFRRGPARQYYSRQHE